jgi:predicted HTH transcriptional regulator
MSVFDEEIRRRLKDVEDHFTERKEAPQEHTMREALTAFANTAIPEKPGIIYVGVRDKGEIIGGDNMDSWQQKISSWAASCFPPVNAILVPFSVEGKDILAVVVRASPARPHFAKAAYIRKGARNEMASQQEIDEWIAYRNSKVRFILDWKDKTIHLQQLKEGIVGSLFDESGAYTLINCTPWFVTLHKLGTGIQKTFPLSAIDLKMNDEKVNELMLIYRPYK